MKNRVLIVDDEPSIREMIVDELKLNSKIQVYEADNGILAMKILSDNKINLLITDLIMPDQDGIEIILQAKKKYPQLKIFAVSGSEEYLRKAEKLEIDQVIEKPFNVLYIVDKIEELLF